jgi:putative endonuclease
MKQYFVDFMSNKSRRLYVGITSKLFKRVFQHKNKVLPGFTARYNFDMLVYYEEFSQVASALTREKEIKGWRREKKLKLILAENPDWVDLSLEWRDDRRGRPSPKPSFAGFGREHFLKFKTSRGRFLAGASE